MKTPVFYTSIRPAEGQNVVDVIRKAHTLGYELIPFEGYTDVDLGAAGNHGPKWDEAKANLKATNAIQRACEVEIEGKYDWPHIVATKNSEG